MNRRTNLSLTESKSLSLQTKLELYSETISVLQVANEKLVKENSELKLQLAQANEKLSSGPPHKISASLTEEKSNLMEIIENFQSRSLEFSGIQSLQQEFEDIEELQSTIKQENQGLREKIQKFVALSPLVQKISSLAQRIFFAFQTLLKGEELNLKSFLSDDKNFKRIEKPEFFTENLNRTKELLEKIFEFISDYSAEKVGDEGCRTV